MVYSHKTVAFASFLLLLLLVLLAIGFGVEIKNSLLAANTQIQRMEETVLLAGRSAENVSDPFGPPWFENAVRDITALGSTIVLGLLTLMIVVYFILRHEYPAAWLITISVVGAQILSSLLKLGIGRPRPDVVLHLMHASDFSFPSGHSLLSTVFFLTIGLYAAGCVMDRRLKIYYCTVATVVTLLVGLSRVYLGVHYPTDVIAGWLIGFAWVLICIKLYYRALNMQTTKACNG